MAKNLSDKINNSTYDLNSSCFHSLMDLFFQWIVFSLLLQFFSLISVAQVNEPFEWVKIIIHAEEYTCACASIAIFYITYDTARCEYKTSHSKARIVENIIKLPSCINSEWDLPFCCCCCCLHARLPFFFLLRLLPIVIVYGTHTAQNVCYATIPNFIYMFKNHFCLAFAQISL